MVNSTPSSPVTRKDTRPPSSHSPLPSRFTPMTGGHRRTGSDPFAFRPQSALQVPRGGKSRPFSVGGGSPFDVNSLDIRAEAVTFKATTTGLVTTLSQCIDMMNKREESWQRKFEKVHLLTNSRPLSPCTYTNVKLEGEADVHCVCLYFSY